MPKPKPVTCELQLSDDASVVIRCGQTAITYRGDADCPYARQATKNREPYRAVVLHHNPPHRSVDWLIDYQIEGDTRRGGHFGYHFYIGETGAVIQGAPLTVRTNHVKGLGYRSRTGFGRIAENHNAIGITCIGAEKPHGYAPTAEQVCTVKLLVQALCQTFEIPLSNVFGHGELQSDRDPTEGTALAVAIRALGDSGI